MSAISLLCGCTTGSNTADRAPEPLPNGVVVAVYQSRTDVVSRSMQVSVQNHSDENLTITAAEFESAQFADVAVWQKDSTVIGAGRTVDLPVQLSESVCTDSDPAPVVRLTWSVNGEERMSEVSPADERDRLTELREAGCFDAAVASVAEFRAETLPRSVVVAGMAAAELDISVSPGPDAADGTTLLVDSVSGTTLFTMLDPATGATSTDYPLGLPVPHAGGSVITLTLVPTRCDPHAVAEDKQGSIFPFSADVPDPGDPSGEVHGTIYVPAETAVKVALISFIRTACGTNASG